MSWGRQPIVIVSSVTTSTLNPCFAARCKTEIATSGVLSLRSRGEYLFQNGMKSDSKADQYNWNHLLPSPFSLATSSIERDDALLMISGTPTFLAARAVASSASGCRIPWTPIGARRSGEEYCSPNNVTFYPRNVMGNLQAWRTDLQLPACFAHHIRASCWGST